MSSAATTRTGERGCELLPFRLVLAPIGLRNRRAEQRLDAEDAGDVDGLGGLLQQIEADMGGRHGEAVRLYHGGKMRCVAEEAGIGLDLGVAEPRQLFEDRLERRKVTRAVKLEREIRHRGL